MKKYQAFKKEFNRLNEKEADLRAELRETEAKLAGQQRLIYDLRIQRELEQGREAEFDKQLKPLIAEETQLVAQVKALEERIHAIEAGKLPRLSSLRDDARSDVLKQNEKLQREHAAKMHDLKQLRGHVIRLLLEMSDTRSEALQLINEFKTLSGRIDSSDEKLRTSIPLLNYRTLKDNTAGNHAPLISPDAELQWAIDGSAPAWFDHWLLSGEILSPSEISAKEGK